MSPGITDYPKSRKKDLLVRELADEIMIYDFKRAKVLSLNRPAALIWQYCDGNHTVNEIAKDVAAKLKIDINEEAVWYVLKRFQGDGLLEEQIALPIAAQQATRRQILKWAAIGSIAALPVVLSIILPTPANAASDSSTGSTGSTGPSTGSDGMPTGS